MHEELIDVIASRARDYRDSVCGMRELILSDLVRAGEYPSPTFNEAKLAGFLDDRFREAGLDDVAIDEEGNSIGVIPGKTGDRNILVVAHLDKVWPEKEDHNVRVQSDRIFAPGIADNSTGAAVLTSLPLILERLGLQLDANVILLGSAKGLGRGDLAGLRFFLENAKVPIHSALCIEGAELGRLSFSSLGMARGEIIIETEESRAWDSMDRSGAIGFLNRILEGILAIEIPEKPKSAILLGSIEAGSGFTAPPSRGRLRFEIRSESAEIVATIQDKVEVIVEKVSAMNGCRASLDIIAHRGTGDIGFDHSLVNAARQILGQLDVDYKITPSVSELAALLDREIPALTLGITKGAHLLTVEESVEIEPVFTGLAQVVAMLEFLDKKGEEE